MIMLIKIQNILKSYIKLKVSTDFKIITINLNYIVTTKNRDLY